ncbi:MAG TPA: MaoC/PaaZ C-terminal domain-containing protein [Burkholderiales bacterium]|nr:MaoC/PaaZ C-terminal domain-containing protein [Burkholderiales bacterium]
MKISADIVGREARAESVRVDKRWIMAYNAALGEVSATPHPLFPVCYEWDATRALREATGLQALNVQLVHAQHDLVIYRSPRADETLTTAARVLNAEQRKPGAFVTIRLAAHGADGEPVSTSDYGMLYRGVVLEGGRRAIEEVEDPPEHSQGLRQIGDVSVAATAAHVYTECARIWNPIHTDPEYARASSLPGIILHGTATLALSISRVMSFFGKSYLRRVRCRFAGMVLMPSTLSVHAFADGTSIAFETRSEKGEAVIERGWIS